ncbi:MAG: rRNA maturation RNase YbeY [Gammaproteobacteria bacterium HGW-Gammaproteobacteria-8]|nr:MAG: rRNA maturation RNase YbeY [Gammaproteobacteria bacterium HGW-Gammaproteobacteria-8]
MASITPTTMSVEIQRELTLDGIPEDADLVRFAELAVDGAEAGICLRIVDEAEGRALNLQWRGKDYATNVLSFPGQHPPGLPAEAAPALFGDVVLCAPVIAREAALQDKPLQDHWAHLVVHGVLHLRGFDHIEADKAAAMEALECRLLSQLGIADPYRDGSDAVA